MNRRIILTIMGWIASLYCIPTPLYGQPATNHVRVDGSVAQDLDAEGKYAYLFIQHENQARFVDSCLIRNNRYRLEGEIPFDDIMAEIVIDGVPASSGGFILNRQDRVRCDFQPLGRFARAKATGSASSEELYRTMNDSIKPVTDKLAPLFQRARAIDQSDPAYAAIQESISSYQKQIARIWHRLLRTTHSGFNAIYAYLFLAPDLSPDEQKRAEAYIAERFPDNINLSMITGRPLKGEVFADPSIESMRVFNRYATLTGEIPPYPQILSQSAGDPSAPEPQSEITITAPPRAADQESTVIIAPPPAPEEEIPKVYGIGDRMADFALPSLQNGKTALSALDSEYVLIDIWASWCIPCREEIPVLKAAVHKYEPRLTVLAVSIDDNLNHWKNAIKADETTSFVHVILRKDNPQHEKLCRLYGIKTIPHSFLLDRNRRIVAIDLRGDELEKKLQELIPESSL